MASTCVCLCVLPGWRHRKLVCPVPGATTTTIITTVYSHSRKASHFSCLLVNSEFHGVGSEVFRGPFCLIITFYGIGIYCEVFVIVRHHSSLRYTSPVDRRERRTDQIFLVVTVCAVHFILHLSLRTLLSNLHLFLSLAHSFRSCYHLPQRKQLQSGAIVFCRLSGTIVNCDIMLANVSTGQ